MSMFETRRPPLPVAIPARGIMTLIACAIVIAGLYFGRDLLVPIVLAVLLAFVLAPVVRVLRRFRLPRVPAVLISVLLAFALLLGIGLAVSRQGAQLAGNFSTYQEAIQRKVNALRLDELVRQVDMLLRGMGNLEDTSRTIHRPPPASGQSDLTPLELARGVAEPLFRPIATTGIVVVFTIFVLLYREDLRDRLIRLAGTRDLHRTMTAMTDAAYRLSRYFLAQVALNASYGIFVGTGLWLIGLPNPVLWGILAGVMRFVPFVGTPIAVVPPVLLALAVDPGWSMAVYVLLLFACSAPLMGQALEPLLYGHSTGLSPVSVIVSATFWAFMWGPIGLLLATPLTVCLVVLGRHVERMQFLDIMLGDGPPLRPEETFYQRALEGDVDGLVAQARQMLRHTPLAVYYDEVALRGLTLAQEDRMREELGPEQFGQLRQHVAMLLEDLAMGVEDPPVRLSAPTPVSALGDEFVEPDAIPIRQGLPAPSWRTDGAMVVIAGRGELDDLAAEMAVQIFRRHGFGARAESNNVLETANLERLDPAAIRLCCLSVLEEGSSAAGVRHFLRRIRRRLPETRIVVALWHAPAGSLMLSALRSENPGETITTSLRETVALCQAVSAWALKDEEEQPAG
ncbi:putative membrane spanning protein [Roseomonas mucosa]|uniref:Pheromone autoinducer 2 transporter n=2 Tax=Roseomonadaceae TaxID=3385906 RepID=A0A379N742_9PROT|nr:AI-2E family transporter [Roseomonas mucosa]AWV23608.1 putative membrane spanning protein [Roseomonas mucosa]MCG7355929.1 AI-2E family transporter [Roseomonas mucosa]MDT8348382.1 AI-2E family transporter [Roseomonas mucosa]QDD95843.1 putative membrane spanning protein [Roseomonas mucosa]QDE00843.1 putative membrane spanning protein [Roseomonas mucosa]